MSKRGKITSSTKIADTGNKWKFKVVNLSQDSVTSRLYDLPITTPI